ncbi:hypothetical protein [Dictyobacter kobayashii]|uniref:HAMP domain-containing protein n=1 Tax=Dictyobacter kobayashii TaxID=2014872 RepID=A0A402AVD0_9CHLR|nr:hypothetical protein [Dictyobacter kobayashii]GCE23035.1 hypothetical protein KDK_68350 [Dictyobacter kobayashii]
MWIILGFIGLFAFLLIILNLTGQVPGQSLILKDISDVAQTAGQWIGFAFCLRVIFRFGMAKKQLQQQLVQTQDRQQVVLLTKEINHVRRARLAWIFLALGIACYGLAGIIWTSYDTRMPTAQVPYPGLYDIGYVLAYPFFMLGTVLLARRDRATVGRLRLIIDAMAIIGTAIALSWFFLLAPSIAGLAQAPSFLAQFLALYFPTGDLLLITVSVLLLFSPLSTKGQEPVLIRLTIGLSCLAVADSILGYFNLTTGFNSGTLLDLLWPLSLLLVGWAAIEHPRSVAREQLQENAAQVDPLLTVNRFSSIISTLQTIVPFILVLLTCAVLLTIVAPRNASSLLQADICALLLVLIVIVRQAMTLTENNRLTRQMRGELVISRRELQVTRRGADVAAQLATERQALEQALQELQEAQAQVAKGNFNVHVSSLPGALLPLGLSFNLMIDRLKTLAQQVTFSRQLQQEGQVLRQALEYQAGGELYPVEKLANQSKTDLRGAFMALAQVQRTQSNQLQQQINTMRIFQAQVARYRQAVETLQHSSAFNLRNSGVEVSTLQSLADGLAYLEQQQQDWIASLLRQISPATASAGTSTQAAPASQAAPLNPEKPQPEQVPFPSGQLPFSAASPAGPSYGVPGGDVKPDLSTLYQQRKA